MEQQTVFIGWDVGGWNCDKNTNSRDAIVLLDAALQILGVPWRGNLTDIITAKSEPNSAQATFLNALFALCEFNYEGQHAVLAIDTPLGFSQHLHKLLHGEFTDFNGPSSQNPYLFRETERFLADNGYQPLSAIKDMIGSQATKGMHVVAKYAPTLVSNGVWQQGPLTIIEAYPSPCKKSDVIRQLHAHVQLGTPEQSGEKRLLPNGKKVHDDHVDALTCAFIAWLWQQQPTKLIQPHSNIPRGEGWIFVPKDCFTETEEQGAL